MYLYNTRRKHVAGSTITKRSVAEAVISGVSNSYRYTGSAITAPGLQVRLDGMLLALNEDYTVSYSDNVAIGMGSVTVTGRGNYYGTVTRTFYIVSAPKGWEAFDLTDTAYVGSSALSDGNTAITSFDNMQILEDGRLFFTDKSTGRMYIWGFTGGTASAGYDSRSDIVQYNTGAFMAPNGLSVVYAGTGFSKTYTRSLGVAFDLSTLGGTSTQILGMQNSVQFISSDGKHLVLKGAAGNEPHVYAMTTPYDFANATDVSGYNMSNLEAEFISATGESSASFYGMCFSDDGKSAVVVWGACVLKLAMSTAWDVTTLSLSSWFKPSQSGASWTAVGVNPAGTRMVLANATDGKLYEFSLSA